MKLNKRKLIRITKIFVVVIFSVLFLIFSALYNDSSRRLIIDYAVSYLQNENFSLSIEGANKQLTHVVKISAKISGNLIEAFNINFERDGIFSRPRVLIQKVVVQSADLKSEKQKNVQLDDKSVNNSQDKKSEGPTVSQSNDSGFDIGPVLNGVKKIKLFIESLKISEAEVSLGDHKYKYDNLSYVADGNQDRFSMKMEQSQFDFILDWRDSVSLKGDFKNIEGFSGNIRINSLESSEPKYEIEIQDSDYKLDASGSFADRLNTVIIEKGTIHYFGKKSDFHGRIFLNKNRAELFTKLSLSDFTDVSKIPEEITKNFQGIETSIVVEEKEKTISSQVEFKKDNRKLGSSNIILQEKNLSIKSDVSWINFWGHNLKSFNVHSKNLKNFVVDITGTDILKESFSIHSEIVNGKNISVQSLICSLKKGKITLKKPFLLKEFGVDTLFKFDLNYFGSLANFFKIDGSVAGNLFSKNGLLGVDAQINRLVKGATEIYNGKVSGDTNNLEVDVGRMKVLGNTLKNLILKKKINTLSFSSKLNNNSKIILNGMLDNEVLKFSGTIQNKNAVLSIKNCSFDFKNRSYIISTEIRDGKKLGKLQILVSSSKINLLAENFSVQGVGKVFDKIFPQCLINGNLKLNPQQDYFSGSGRFKLEKLLSQRSIVDIDIKQNQKGLLLQGHLHNATDDLVSNIFIPVVIKRNLDFPINNNSLISGMITGHAYVENIFEFPDGVTLKGQVKSDLKISGSVDHPIIQGAAEYMNATIIVSDVVLKNGIIKLEGQNQKLVVRDAYFVDSYGKKAQITGFATLFFSNIVPNLNTDLLLDFDNFRLFDTDAMKINVLGKGKMTGPIDNLKLSGQVKIPLCELKFSEVEDEDQYKDITVTNDILLSKNKKPREDFFFYDLDLDGSLIKIVGDIYQLEFVGNLHLGTYNKQATLSGHIDLDDGKLNLFGKRMIFEKSKVEFLEQFPFDPKMKLSCSRDLETMKVILDVKNNPGESMEIDLHSQPNQTQDVILSQMLFGKSIADLSVGEAAQLAHALNSLNRKGYIFSILNAFQDIGLVDSLSFSTENNSSSLYKNSQSSSSKLNVKAGKYLSDKVYISVNKKEEDTSFDVDLSLGSNASFKVNTLGEVGVSWKFRY